MPDKTEDARPIITVHAEKFPGPPYRCPVCGGTGLVPNGFYRRTTNGFYRRTTDTWVSTSTEPEKCRSCDGKGYVR